MEFVYEPFDKMESFMKEAFTAIGVPQDEAAVCANVLIEADKRGFGSHGVGRFKPIYIDRINDGIQHAVTNFEVVKEGPTTAVIDGHDGMGQVIGTRAMQMAIDKAKKYGLGAVAVRNSTHYGIAGYYCTMAAENGMIGMTTTNARPSIAPTFGVENMLGTNPLSFGMPTDDEFPFVLDCATATTQRGKVEQYVREGKELKPGWVIDQEGKTSTDSAAVLQGLIDGTCALTPLGGIGEDMAGYKGYGYATVVELLSAALQSGNYLKMLGGIENGKKVPYHLGHFFLAMDVSAFVDLNEFKKTAGNILRDLRASKKAPGEKRIFTAGEKEYEVWLERKDKGVPLDETMQKNVLDVKKMFSLNHYTFSFE